MSFNKDALLHKLQDEADKWEEVPDEDLWQDGEQDPVHVAIEIYSQVCRLGNWKLMRRKDNE